MIANVLSCALLFVAPALGQQVELKPDEENLLLIKPGTSASEVRRLLGKPDRIARQILFRRHLEQWIYENPVKVRIEIIYSPGEEAHVQSIIRSRKDMRR